MNHITFNNSVCVFIRMITNIENLTNLAHFIQIIHAYSHYESMRRHRASINITIHYVSFITRRVCAVLIILYIYI